MVGQQIGQYRIAAQIGAGGMGVVYRARDLKLERDVAVKVLPSELLGDAERRARFEREARLLASLSHTHIGAIYGVEDYAGGSALILEYVDGPTLAERSAGLPVREALTIARQIADALDAAHERGVIHRDLKPANIKLTAAGAVKVLDFGLAKAIVDPFTPGGADLTHSPTVTIGGTRAGALLGTAAYMSPEQARGLPVDKRTDIWAFGCIVYELLARRCAFARDTVTDTLVAVVERDPDWAALPVETPEAVVRLLRRCLEKDVKLRLRDIADARIEIDDALAAGFGRERRSRRRWTAVAAAAAVAIATTAAALLVYRRNAESPTAVRASFAQLTFDPGIEWFPSISPDGKWVVYAGDSSGNRDIYLQSITGQKPLNLTSDSPDDDDQPSLSPDGERIAFRSERDGGGIFVMGRTGEAVRRLTREGYRPAWSWDGTRLAFSTEPVDINPQNGRGPTELRIVDVRSGEVRRFPDAGLIVHASWSPHDLRLVVSIRNSGSRQMDIATIPVAGGAVTPLVAATSTEWNAVWSADGRYVYYTSDAGGTMNLWRVRVDETSGRALSPPEPLPTPSPMAVHPVVSNDGRHIAFSSVLVTTNVAKLSFNPATATFEGSPADVTTGTRPWSSPDISSDGEWLAFYSFQNPQGHVYVARTDGSGLRQLTGDSNIDRVPRWSPDGQWIAFFSNRSGDYRIWKIRPDGSELQQMTSAGGAYPTWSPDGTRLATTEAVANRATPLGTYIFDTRKPWDAQTPEMLPPLRGGGADQHLFVTNSWSPDGTMLAGQSSLGATGIVTYSLERRQYTELTDFGEFPVWFPDSRTLLFAADSGKSYRIIDTVTRQTRTVFKSARAVFGPPRLDHAGRTAYFSRRVTESDIWIMTLADESR